MNAHAPNWTTARPRPFIEELPSFRDRVLAGGGMDILEKIAARQRTPARAVARDFDSLHIPGGSYNVAVNLRDLGLLKIRGTAMFAQKVDSGEYTLTDAGWELVGNKPMHLEGTV